VKAAICPRYGPPEVLRIQDRPAPSIGPRDVLIRVVATTVTSGDLRVRGLDVPPAFRIPMRLALGLRGPRQPILGTECAGVVEQVGASVTRFAPGDAVVAFTDFAMGCHAELVRVAEDGVIAAKPANLSFAAAAALSFGGTTALHFLRRVRLQPGERVLVNGAAGGVGSALVQLARHQGAQVTAVCRGSNAEWVRALGAERVIDYTVQDFASAGEAYDVIFDVAGTAPPSRSRRALRPKGRLALLFAGIAELAAIPRIHATSEQRVIAGTAVGLREDLEQLVQLAADGAYLPPIERVIAFDAIVDAHRAAALGGKRGTVAVSVGAQGEA